MEDLAVEVARQGEKIANIEDRFDSHEKKQNGSLDKIWAELKTLREEYAGRPTWGVSLLITTLVGLVVALGSKIIMGR